MLCSQCGATSDAGQRFCYNCGARLNEQQPQAPTYNAPSAFPPPPPAAPIQPGGHYPPADAYQSYQQGTGPVLGVIPNSGLAITSLVAGIIGWVLIPVLAALVAIVTGHMARREIRNAPGRLAGDGMAMVGLVLGYSQLALIAIGFCFLMFFIVIAAVA